MGVPFRALDQNRPQARRLGCLKVLNHMISDKKDFGRGDFQ